MEIASSFIAAVTPPPFQAGVEEAKRDAQARESIPQPKESHQSSRNDTAADNRGGTSGANSQLYAQSEGLIRAAVDNVRERAPQRQNSSSKGTEKSEKNGTGSSSTAGAAARSQSSAAQAAVSGFNASAAAHNAATSISGVAALISERTQSAGQERTRKTAKGARYAADLQSAQGTSTNRAGRAVAARYNSIIPNEAMGNTLDFSA